MIPTDDQLEQFAQEGVALPAADREGYVEHDGARIWYASFGDGTPVLLLHGGLGHSGNWGHQVPALLQAGCRVIVLDSRGHGRSTRDDRPYSYDLMATDVLAVMEALASVRARLVGWSDGACTALVLAAKRPERVEGVFFFACNMDATGTKPFEATAALDRCFARHRQDYRQLSATPDDFERFVEEVSLMQRTQPDYSRQQLKAIRVPVVVAQSLQDEFIRNEHAAYLAETIPGATLRMLAQGTHFAPLQRPSEFNAVLLDSLRWMSASER